MAMSSYYYPDDYYYRQSIQDCYDCISVITDNLYLTNRNGAKNYPMLRDLGITTIISVTFPQNVPRPNHPYIDYIRVPIPDDPKFNIGKYLDDVADTIHQVIQAGGRVLVHCYLGMSRGPTMVMAYLMKYGRMPLREAYELVSRQRPVIQPNCGFWRHLIQYEWKLFRRNTVYMEDVGC